MKQPATNPALTPKTLKGVKKIIVVASGKGGVGKSTVAAGLAIAASELGLKAGILDADIYGPSLAKIFGVNEKPMMLSNNMLRPVEKDGLQLMSIGFIMPAEKAVMWRGALVMGAVRQMLFEVAWELDCLFIDLPPGTGDAQLTLAQSVILDGAVIVSTPQDLALADARRAMTMCRQTGTPILGLIENMSQFTCDDCGTVSYIFGHGGAAREAEQCNIPYLGALPLDKNLREAADSSRLYSELIRKDSSLQVFQDLFKKTASNLGLAQV